MMGATQMNAKHIAWWLAGVLAVLIVIAAGAWSLGVATAYAYADEPAVQTANVQTAKKLTAADPLPGSEKLPLRNVSATSPSSDAATATATAAGATSTAGAANATSSAAPEPASFTVSGKKYLEGRALKAGEFSFTMVPVGVYTLPMGSPLIAQLRSSTLSAAEKYELVAHGGLSYTDSPTQPVPAQSVVTNQADGTVEFAPLTFDEATLGKFATRRYAGTVFCYAVAEQAPRTADGTLTAGATENADGRCVFKGVTYDNSVKRVYLYVYETGDDGMNCHIEIVPLGDATFDTATDTPATGQGDGFRNVYVAAADDSSSDEGTTDAPSATDKPSITAPKPTTPGVTAPAPDKPEATTPDEPEGAGSDKVPNGTPSATVPGQTPSDTPSHEAPEAGTAPSEKPSTGTSTPAAKPETGAPEGTVTGSTSTAGSATGSGAHTGTAAGAPSTAGSSDSATMDPTQVDDSGVDDFKTVVTEGPATMPEASVTSTAANAGTASAAMSATTIVTSVNTDSSGAIQAFAQTGDEPDRASLIALLIVVISLAATIVAYQKTRAQEQHDA